MAFLAAFSTAGTVWAQGTPSAAPIPSDEALSREFGSLCQSTLEGPNPYFGSASIVQLQKLVAQPGQTPEARIRLQRQLAKDYLRVGRNTEAAELAARTLQEAAQRNLEVRFQLQVLFELGLVYLRMGEVANCLNMHGPAMCILPFDESAVHHDPAAANEALRAFKAVINGVPDYALVDWLANVAAMATGQYPEALPAGKRAPTSRFTSPQSVGRFVDVAHAAGIHMTANSGGAVVDDFNGDGLLDVVASSAHPCTPLHLFLADGQGKFVDATEGSGLDVQLGGLNLIHADVDEDGDPDLLVLRGGWFGKHGQIRNSLLRNDGTDAQGKLRFTDVTAAAGLAYPAYPTQTAGWADYDLDGDLDLYIGNEADAENLVDPSNLGAIEDAYPAQLFRNDGPGPDGIPRFTDVARAAGVQNQRFAKGVTWGDADGDGDPDLYVSNIGPNRLYENRGDGTFVDVAERAGLVDPNFYSFTTWWFDLENDGDLDLFVGDYEALTLDLARWFMGQDLDGEGRPRLYRNDGGGRFTEVGESWGLVAPALPMGGNFGDLDNDGFLDFYLGTGLPPYEALMPNLMYRNDGGRRFVDVTYSGGFGHLQKGHGVAFADLDHDGDQDIFQQMGGAVPGDVYPSVLYENPGADATRANGWIALELEGRRSNRDALGARLEISVETPTGPRTIYRTVGTGGSFGGNPRRQHIGLGRLAPGATVDVTVRWPTSGRPAQTFSGLAPAHLHLLREDDPEPTQRTLEPLRLGGQ